MSTRDLLGSLTQLARELDTLTGQRPDLAELASIAVSKYGRVAEDEVVPFGLGELNVTGAASPAGVLAWCEAIGATSGWCLPGDDDWVTTITAAGRLGQRPVRVLTGLPRDLAQQLGQQWTVHRLRELLSAPAATEPAAGGGR